MNINELIEKEFVGKRLISINDRKINKIIKSISHIYYNRIFVYLDDGDLNLFFNDNYELEESGM